MKVAYISSNWSAGTPEKPEPAFARPIVDELEARGHEVLMYRHTDDVPTNMYQLGQIKLSADRVFVDWVQSPLETVLSQWGPDDAPVFVRAHRIEMYNREYLQALQWSRVKCLFFIAQHVQDRFLEGCTVEKPQEAMNLGHVGVDLEFWRQGDEPKPLEPPWRIVLAGNITPKKRQYTAIQMLKDLPEAFHLDLIGSNGPVGGYGTLEYVENAQDLIHNLGLESRIWASGKLSPEALRERLQQAHFVLSTSNEEGCATIVAEGMACGCVPLVNCWRGAEAMYPPEWVWDSPLDLYKICKAWARRSSESRQTLADSMPIWVRKYDAKPIARALVDKITGPVDGRSVGEWYSADEMFGHMVEQYGNSRQQAALASALSLLPAATEGVQVLDVGCSVGYLVHGLENAGYKTIGVDVSERALQWASEQGPGLFIASDCTQSLPRGPFDLVTMIDALEHLPGHRQSEALIRCLFAMKPGARLLLRFPHGAKDRQVLEGTIYPKLVARMLRDHGCTIERYGKCGDEYFEIVARKAEGGASGG